MLWYFFVTGLKGSVQSAAMLLAQMTVMRLKFLKKVNFNLPLALEKISLYLPFRQHMEELQVDTGRGLLLVKNTIRDVQANRRKIPRIGRRPTKALLEVNAEMGTRSAQPSGKILNRRKLPRIVPRDAAKAITGIDAEFGKMTNRRKIPRIVPTDAAKTAVKAITGIGVKLSNMVNRRKIPRIGPRPANKTDAGIDAGTDAKSAAKSDKKTKI